MIRGLLWLPLLAVFGWLAWAGWNEYQKLEAYRTWAAQFDHAKYDIYAVLGQKDNDLTWGKPTRKGPINLQTFSLQQVESIRLRVGDQMIDLDAVQDGNSTRDRSISNSSSAIEFYLANAAPITVPFTDRELAIQWVKHLQRAWQQLPQKA